MESLQCITCDKVFTTKYTLKTHLNKNKKCMIARGITISSEYVCKCKHISMTKNEFNNHIQNCLTYQIELIKTKFEEKLAEKDAMIFKLEAKLEKFENVVIANTNNEAVIEIDNEEQTEEEGESNRNSAMILKSFGASRRSDATASTRRPPSERAARCATLGRND